MFKRQKKELNELTVLTELIKRMEDKGDHPEALIRNIQLIGKVVKILEAFQTSMKNQLSES